MVSRTELGAFAALAVLVAAAVALLVLLGPVGWPFAALLIVVTWLVLRYSGYLDRDGDPAEKVSCGDCGARNRAARDDCHHCGAPLP